MEQNHPSDNLRMPWPTCGLGLGEKEGKRPKKGDFQRKGKMAELTWFGLSESATTIWTMRTAMEISR